MGETNMMTTAQPIESVSDTPTKVPVPCAFPSPNVAHQALASVPLPAAVPQDYRQSVCMPHPAPHASEANSESPARKVEDDEKTRVTVWNPTTGKKLSGNAGVQKKNLAKYLRTHPDWVVWNENHRGALKRKRIDMELGRARQQQRQKIEISIQIDPNNKIGLAAPAASAPQSMLWAHLLAVCSEEFTQDDEDDMDDLCSPRIDNFYSPRCVPGSFAKGPISELAFVPGGLTSPA